MVCLLVGMGGRAIGLVLAKAGVDVAFCYLSRRDDTDETRAAIEAAGRRCCVVQTDVSRAGAVTTMVAAVIGEIRPQALEDIQESDWDRIIDVHLKSAFLATQAVVNGGWYMS